MSTTEIVLNMLAEVSTTEISKTDNPSTFEENKNVAKIGGEIAGQARENIEKSTGKSVITNKNATELNQVVVDLIEGIGKDSEK